MIDIKDWILILFMLSIPLFIYRLHHPEQTETQLFFNTINAYKEFFTGKMHVEQRY